MRLVLLALLVGGAVAAGWVGWQKVRAERCGTPPQVQLGLGSTTVTPAVRESRLSLCD